MKLAASAFGMDSGLSPVDSSWATVSGPDTKRRQPFSWARDLPEADEFIKSKLDSFGYSKRETVLVRVFIGGVEKKLWPNTEEWKLKVKYRIHALVKAHYGTKEAKK